MYPWDQLSTIGSPFVATFAKVGITAAAGLINFVVITAAMSGCNSGIYSAGRMLYTLGVNGQAPKYFTKLSGNGVPLFGTVGVIIGLAIGVVLSYIAPKNLFVYVYSASVLPGMVPWFVILISQINFRKEKGRDERSSFQNAICSCYKLFNNCLLIMVLIGMWFNDDTRISLIVGIIFLAIVTISFYAFGIGKRPPLDVQNDQEISSK